MVSLKQFRIPVTPKRPKKLAILQNGSAPISGQRNRFLWGG